MVTRTRVSVPDESVLQMHRNTRPELWGPELTVPLDLSNLARYPDVGAFQTKYAEFLHVDPAKLLVTAGIDGAVRALFEDMALCSVRRDWTCVPGPTWAMYEVYAEAYGIPLDILYPESFCFEPDVLVETLKAQLPDNRTGIVFLPNPGGHVEYTLDMDHLKDLAGACRKAGTILAIDEAYHGFGAPTALSLAGDGVYVMRSFSKAWGLPGIRIGCLVGDVARIASRRPSYEAASLGMAVASWAMDHKEIFAGYLSEVEESRNRVRAAMEARGIIVHGRNSNSLLLYVPQAVPKLKARGILARDYGGWVGVTLGGSRATTAFLKAMEEVLDG